MACARIRRSLLTASDVGFILVNRQATSETVGESYSRAAGVDANFRFARLQADPASPSQRPDLTAKGGLQEIVDVLQQRHELYQQCADLVDNLDHARENLFSRG